MSRHCRRTRIRIRWVSVPERSYRLRELHDHLVRSHQPPPVRRVPLTGAAQHVADHGEPPCPCGARAHSLGAWSWCDGGHLWHRYGPGRLPACPYCTTTETTADAEPATH